MKEHLIARSVGIMVGYSKGIMPTSGGSLRMTVSTAAYSRIVESVLEIFDSTTYKNYPIRQLGIFYSNLVDETAEGYDLFTDVDQIEKEKKLETAVLFIKDKFGKNAILRGIDFQDGATQMIRNKLIGGHNGG